MAQEHLLLRELHLFFTLSGCFPRPAAVAAWIRAYEPVYHCHGRYMSMRVQLFAKLGVVSLPEPHLRDGSPRPATK